MKRMKKVKRALCKNPAHGTPCYADCPACLDECQEFNEPKRMKMKDALKQGIKETLVRRRDPSALEN